MSAPRATLPRRTLLRLGLASTLAALRGRTVAADAEAARSQHFPFGPVLPPRPVPAWAVRTNLGAATDMATLLRGRVSAVHLMFTGCSATCPIQGALFAQAQQLSTLAPAAAQFVSISIDPLSDTPAALDAWLGQFSARPDWLAVAPRVEDVERMIELLGSGGESRPAGNDPHNGQVYLIDRRGELVFRTASMPPASEIASLMKRVGEKG